MKNTYTMMEYLLKSVQQLSGYVRSCDRRLADIELIMIKDKIREIEHFVTSTKQQLDEMAKDQR